MLHKLYSDRVEQAREIFETEGKHLDSSMVKQASRLAPIVRGGNISLLEMVENVKVMLVCLDHYNNLDFFVEAYKDHDKEISFRTMQRLLSDSIYVQGETFEELGRFHFIEFGLDCLDRDVRNKLIEDILPYFDFIDYWIDLVRMHGVYYVEGGAYIL